MSDHGSSQSQGDSPDDQSHGSSRRSRLPPLYRRMVLHDWLTRGVQATITDPATAMEASPSPSPTSASSTVRVPSDPITRARSNSAHANPTPSITTQVPRVQCPIQNAPTFTPSTVRPQTSPIIPDRSASSPANTTPSITAQAPSVQQPIQNVHGRQGLENDELNRADREPVDPRVVDEGKLLVRVDMGGNLQPSNKASRRIRDGVMMHPHPLGYCWKTVPPEIAQLYWEEFQKRCTWDNSRYSTNRVYNAYLKKIRKRYSDFFSEMRTKNLQPKFVHDDVWKAWRTAWSTPEYAAKCLHAKKNRHNGDLTQPAEATHVAGSISHAEVFERLAAILGRNPTPHELFAFTHTKRHDGTSWTNPRAQAVGEEYVRALSSNLQSEENRAIDLLQTYYNVVGGHNKKRRIYGLGDAACRYYGSATSQCSNTPGASSSDPHAHLQSQLDRLRQVVQTLTESQEERTGEDIGSRQLNIGVTPQMIKNVIEKQNDLEVQMKDQIGSLQTAIWRFELELAEIRGSRAHLSSSSRVESDDEIDLT